MIKAVINVEAPRQHVFSILTDYSRYKEWLPGCEQSTVVSSGAESTDTEIVINSMKRMRLGLRFEAHPAQSLNFRMISGKDIKSYAGSYRLMDSADGQGTVVIAEMEIDAGAMVPKFMVDRVAKKSIDETGAALKKYVRTIPLQAGVTAGPGRAVEARARRAKRLIQVIRTEGGYRVWMMGESYVVKSSGK
jgi:carbon monoxide dehydrogenase subunit G